MRKAEHGSRPKHYVTATTITSNKPPKTACVDDERALRFRRSHRLLDASSFSRVFKKPQRSRDKFFTVLYRSNGSVGARLGLAIAKKHCRLASGRNRIKRVIRESFRQQQGSLGSIDVVVMNTPAAQRANNKTLFESLESHWQRCRSPQTRTTRRQGSR